jgi:hypothetical protein
VYQGVVFEDCYPKRLELTVAGTVLPFIDLDNLKKAKKAAGRPQDLADIDNLQ